MRLIGGLFTAAWILGAMGARDLGIRATDNAQITVRLVHPPEVARETLEKAEGMAGYILGKAGVEVHWLECPCGLETAANELRLQIVNRRPSPRHGEAIGVAVLVRQEEGDGYAGVFYPVVQESARGLDADEFVLLGAAMVHELGHLLLRSNGHSHAGVMGESFRREQVRLAGRGELLFTPEQGERIRAAVERRTGLAAGRSRTAR